MQEETRESKSALPRFFTLEMFMFTVTALSGLVLLWSIAVPYRNVAIMVCAGVVFTLSIVVVIRLIMDPDSVRARQSDSMLKLASQTLTCMNDGMDYKAAQKICGLLLPSTAAIAVAITDKSRFWDTQASRKLRTCPAASSAPTRPMPRSPTASCASYSRPKISASPASRRISRRPSSCRLP